ncbi:MAG: ABC transporter permease [Planctomycetota bacterium]|nr:MAG: ABC transporter permease [Planctomycetota bacterium]
MPAALHNPARFALAVVAEMGRAVLGLFRSLLGVTARVGAVWRLLLEALVGAVTAPLLRRGTARKQLFPLMMNVGARSAPIVSLVALLTGAILVLQTGDVIQEFGQISEVPGLVALSMTRALGPLMTAIVLIGRVGASYTAVLGSMTINEEILALETMSISPVEYLVSPRLVSMLVMTPCLVVFAYLVGMLGGGIVAFVSYSITPAAYLTTTFDYLTVDDIFGGLLKAVVFGLLIAVISCHYGLTTTGGPMGLGRNIMVSVVTCIVVIVAADAILTAFLINYVLEM